MADQIIITEDEPKPKPEPQIIVVQPVKTETKETVTEHTVVHEIKN